MSIGVMTLVSTLIIAAWTDWKEQRIYNKLLIPSWIMAILIHLSKSGLDGFTLSFLGMTVGFSFLILPYLLGGLGAGDVKLLAVIGAYGGPLFVFYTFIYSAMIGGVISIAILVVKRKLKLTVQTLWLTAPMLNFNALSIDQHEGPEGFPYGIPLALGALITLVTNGIAI